MTSLYILCSEHLTFLKVLVTNATVEVTVDHSLETLQKRIGKEKVKMLVKTQN